MTSVQFWRRYETLVEKGALESQSPFNESLIQSTLAGGFNGFGHLNVIFFVLFYFYEFNCNFWLKKDTIILYFTELFENSTAYFTGLHLHKSNFSITISSNVGSGSSAATLIAYVRNYW